MTRGEYAKISCAVDAALAPLVEEALEDLTVPEVFVQRGKQVSLADRSGLFGLRPSTAVEESRAWIYRLYVPRESEGAVMRRLAETADLHLPGRGSVYAEDAEVLRSSALEFDPARLASPAADGGAVPERHTILCCIVQRGMAEALTRTVLEMGLCVPLVSFGEGMGLRNKLGLLRITIPVEKEVVYFIVPTHDADLLEGIAVHKARLDRPGQGFIYRSVVRASAVNLRVRRGSRRHAASMEQIVAALDDIRGSAEWRRTAPSRSRAADPRPKGEGGLVCLSITAEEGSVGDFVRAAMDAGAGGATLLPLERRSYGGEARPRSHARECCDLIIPEALRERVLRAVEERGLFAPDASGIAEFTAVHRAITYSP